MPRLAWPVRLERFLRIVIRVLHYLCMDVKLVARTLEMLRLERDGVRQAIAEVYEMPHGHIDDHDLERYHLGMVKDEAELAALEEHLLWCQGCLERAEAAAQYVDAIRSTVCESGED
jgi:hypothetical protein